MTQVNRKKTMGIGKYILKFRAPIGLVLVLITGFMGYWAAHVRIATKFKTSFRPIIQTQSCTASTTSIMAEHKLWP